MTKKTLDRILLVICVALVLALLTLIILDCHFFGLGKGTLYKEYNEKYHSADIKLDDTLWESKDSVYKLDFTTPVTDIGEYDVECAAVAYVDGVSYSAKLYLDKKTISLSRVDAPYNECLYGYFDFTDTEMRIQVKRSDIQTENSSIVLSNYRSQL